MYNFVYFFILIIQVQSFITQRSWWNRR